MKADGGRVACASWRWFWKRCLGVTVTIVVLIVSLIAGTMLSAVFFHAVEL
jgi:hypothetical protein